MLSTVYVACLLAAAAIATPTGHAPRSFVQHSQDAAHADENHDFQASSTPFGSSVNRADSSNSASSHNSGFAYDSGLGGAGYTGGVDPSYGAGAGYGSFQGSGYNALSANSANANGFQAGGFGGYGGSSSFSSSQQSSTTSSVSSSFQSLNGLIGGFQSQLASGQFTQAAAYQRCQQIADYFQRVLTQANNCGRCFQDPGQFSSIASSTMSQFTNFVSSLQSTFDGSAFGQIASPFSALSSSFQQFFQKTASSSFSSSSIVPQNFAPVFQRIMPSLIPTIQQLNSNSFSQDASSNSFNTGAASGFGTDGGSSFASSQQSSITSSVSSSFQSINGLIGGFQSQLASGQLTRSAAYQQCQQLAQSFQTALRQANTCGSCFRDPGQFSSVASSTMSQFTSYMSSLQSTFGRSAYGQIAAPLSTLSSSFQQFFQKTSSSSSFSSTSIVPQNFGPVMQDVMPSLISTLQQS